MDQGSQAGDLLGIALLTGREPAAPAVDDVQRDTVLAALRDTGFVTYGADASALRTTALIVTGAALDDGAGNQGATVARFAAGLAPHGIGDAGRRAGRLGIGHGRGGGDPVRRRLDRTRSATVDDVDSQSGRITSVLALQRDDQRRSARAVRHRPAARRR